MVVTLVVYAHAMAGPLPGDEISTADSGLLRLLSLAGVVLLACDGVSDYDRLVTVLRRLAFAAGLVALLGRRQYATGELFVDRIRVPGLTAGTEGWTLSTAPASPPGRDVDEPDRVRRRAGHDAPARHRVRVDAVALPMDLPRHAGGDDRLDLLLDVALGLPLLARGHDRPRAVVGRAPSAPCPGLPRGGQRGDVRDGPRPAGIDPGAVLQRRPGPEHRLPDRQLRHRRRVHLQLPLARQGLRDVPPEVLDPRQRLPRHDDRDRLPGTRWRSSP